jgi:glycosyltransferase involved in cell wall biosynthesis
MSNGGAEIAAFQLFRGMQAQADWEAWYLGCGRYSDADLPTTVLSQPFSDREYLYVPGEFNWFSFANRDSRFPREIQRLFGELSPDVVHFHHYINFGVEVFHHVRRVVPECKILLTLHEYLAICHHFGQMVTKPHRNLCYQSSPIRCQRCFPEFSRSDFFLRDRYIKRFLNLVDVFVAPSRFLAERYIAWGLPQAKIVVLENVIPPAPAVIPAAPVAEGPLRIGYFGQISALKGIHVLFDAAEILAEQGRTDLAFDIFGDYRGQPPELQAEFLERLQKVGRNVQFHGPYDRQRVDRLMQSVHAVLIPSVWWENSPVVIQEALRNNRPIICSDIGGMAEKVRDGIDGFHFPAGSAMALAFLLRRLAVAPELLAQRAAQMRAQPAPPSTLDAHIRLYREHLERK